METKYSHYLAIKISFLILNFCTYPVYAEPITSDHSLINPTQVNNSGTVWEINGGTTRGSNLFHSFQNFSIPSGHIAKFRNSSKINNIIGRVTGKLPSIIDGTIYSSSNSNLILINSKGISFGSNATLDIGGSFLGTTANSIYFEDGLQFLSSIEQKKPLLSMQTPVGLNFTRATGEIKVLNTGHEIFVVAPNSFPLGELASPLFGRELNPSFQVKTGKTLALIGGKISLDGGILSAKEGQIELGSIKTGNVALSQATHGWNFTYNLLDQFSDITLQNSALVDTSSISPDRSSGSIHVQGQDIDLINGAVVISQNLGTQAGGDISVNSTGELSLYGTSTGQRQALPNDEFKSPIIRTQITTPNVGKGSGGEIRIRSKKLTISEGARIGTTVLPTGIGKGGSLFVNIDSDAQISGFSSINPLLASQIIAETNSFAFAAAGNIDVEANNLQLMGGSNITSTTNIGNGNGGNTSIKVHDNLTIEGENPVTEFPSVISASTVLSSGNAQNISIDTSKLTLKDGGRIDASAFTSGNAGSVSITAKDYVIIEGSASPENPSIIISSANRLTQAGAPSVPPEGNSGSIKLNTPLLVVKEQGSITVRNDGPGNAGNLNIDVDLLLLNQGGRITASTQSGLGGNIRLKLKNLLLSQKEGVISAEARGQGQGGNISIEPLEEFEQLSLIATPNENNDIIADAFGGPGGNVMINSSLIIGFQERTRTILDSLNAQDPTQIETNDITALSREGGTSLDGIIEITNPANNPNQNVALLPEQPIDVSQKVTQVCQKITNRNKKSGNLVILSREGLNSSLSNIGFSDNSFTSPWIESSSTSHKSNSTTTYSNSLVGQSTSISEAQYWKQTNDGKIALISNQIPIFIIGTIGSHKSNIC